MATVVEIPVRNDLEAYSFTIELDGTNYVLSFRFNVRMDRWAMDIAKTDGTVVLAGVVLETGVDLTGRYVSDSLPPGRFLAYDESGQGMNAGRYDLGDSVKLLYEEQTA